MRNRIIIADTDEASREILTEMFEEDFEVVEFDKGSKTLDAIVKGYSEIAAVVMDMDLGDLSAADILNKINAAAWFETIPFIVLSADFSLKQEKLAIKAGATEFNKKPFDSSVLRKKVKKLAELYTMAESLQELKRKNEELEAKVGVAASAVSGGPMAAGGDGSISQEFFANFRDKMLYLLGCIIEFRNPENAHHLLRMQGIIRIMGTEMIKLYPELQLTPEKVELIVAYCPLHDIGKAAIPDSVLLKPGRFTNDEYEYMKSHTLRGIELADEFSGLFHPDKEAMVRNMIRSHHEKYDGGGYPDGLIGDEIPIEAQLISIADTYDSLVSDKVYKKGFPKDVAFNMINAGECGVFPPKILETLKVCREKIEAWEDSQA